MTQTPAQGGIYLSLIAPAYNERENLAELVERCASVLRTLDGPCEIIVVDDGSTDGSRELLTRLRKTFPELRALEMSRNSGQTAAMAAGFRAARGRFVASIDADLQNDPSDIPGMLAMMDEWDMVNGWRKDRQDNWLRKVSTKVANGVRNRLSGESIRDSACSLKVYKRECLERIKFFKGMHRFMPTLVQMEGFRVAEVPVKHHPRTRGKAKYGMWNRVFRAFVDLLAVRWMKKRIINTDCREQS